MLVENKGVLKCKEKRPTPYETKKKKRFDGTFDGKIATEVARVLFFAVV